MYLRNTKNWNMLQSIKKARLNLFCLFVCSDCLRNKIITSYISKNLRQNIWSQRKGNEFANSPLRDELNNFWVIKYTFFSAVFYKTMIAFTEHRPYNQPADKSLRCTAGPHWYAVQVSDTTMPPWNTNAGIKTFWVDRAHRAMIHFRDNFEIPWQ